MRHNSELQTKADNFARSLDSDYIGAAYYGRIDEPCAFRVNNFQGTTFVYTPIRKDTTLLITGLPHFILIQGNEIFDIHTVEGFDILRQIRCFNSHNQGRRLLKELEHKYHASDFEDAEEKARITNIIDGEWIHTTHWSGIDNNQLFIYLELANRTGKKVVVKEIPSDIESYEKEYVLTIE